MEEWLKRRVDAVLDAALLYVAVELVFPALIPALVFIGSSEWAMMAVGEVVGLSMAFACLATGRVPPCRSKMPGPGIYRYYADVFTPPRRSDSARSSGG